MRDFLTRHLAVLAVVLAVSIAASLAFNVYLLTRSMRTDDRVDEVAGGAAVLAAQAGTFLDQVTSLTPLLDEALTTADAELEALRTSTIAFDVEVDQVIPVSASFPFQRALTFPIDTSIPINETFETRVTVALCPRTGATLHMVRQAATRPSGFVSRLDSFQAFDCPRQPSPEIGYRAG